MGNAWAVIVVVVSGIGACAAAVTAVCAAPGWDRRAGGFFGFVGEELFGEFLFAATALLRLTLSVVFFFLELECQS